MSGLDKASHFNRSFQKVFKSDDNHCWTLVQNLTFLLQMSKIQINLLKTLKIIYLYEVHKTLLLQTKNCKINNFYKLYKTLLLEN